MKVAEEFMKKDLRHERRSVICSCCSEPERYIETVSCDPYAERCAILQDLKGIPGPSVTSFLKLNFSLDDVLQSASMSHHNDAQFNTLLEPSQFYGDTYRHSAFESSESVTLLPPTQSSLIRNRILYQPRARSEIILITVYTVCTLFHGFYLFGMQFNLFTFATSYFKENHYEKKLQGWVNNNHDSDSASLPLSSFNFDLQRFDMFYTIACFPMPFIFSLVMFYAAKLIQKSFCYIVSGITTYLRRHVNIVCRQALDESIDDYLKRLEFLDKPPGCQLIHQHLHSALNMLDDTIFSANPPRSLSGIDKEKKDSNYTSSLKQILENESQATWRPICISCYVLPGIISFLVNFGAIYAVLNKSIFNGWSPEKQSIKFLFHHPEDALCNEGLQWILAIVGFEVLCWIWVIVVLAPDFFLWVIDTPGIFSYGAAGAIRYLNQMIQTVWDSVVLRLVMAYIVTRKRHDVSTKDCKKGAYSRQNNEPDTINHEISLFPSRNNIYQIDDTASEATGKTALKMTDVADST